MADAGDDGASGSEHGKPSNDVPPALNSTETPIENSIDNEINESKPDNDKSKAEIAIAEVSSTDNSSNDCKNEGDTSKATNHAPSPMRPSVFGCIGQSAVPQVCSPNAASFGGTRNIFSARSSFCSRMENKSAARSKPVLRPSQLTNPNLGEASPKCTNPFTLNPSKLANPFARAEDSNVKPQDTAAECSSQEVTSTSSSNTENASKEVADSSSSASTPDRQQSCGRNFLVAKFVPLSTPSGSAQAASQSSSVRLPAASSTPAPGAKTPGNSGFVFGQNLHERVNAEPEAGASCSSDTAMAISDEGSCSSASATTNGTSEMLFTSVIQKEHPEKPTDSSVDERNKKSLSEAAREYEESRAVKRKYEEVTVITGEEEENNILQMDCKLFVYDGLKFNYSEGVHGSLRVNDPPNGGKKVTTQSRVIVRMAGSLRVLMNTKIWAGMKIEKPNRKIVRMTAMDTLGQIKVFLISSSPAESEMLYRILETRIRQQKEVTGACRNGSVEGHDRDEKAEESAS